MSLFCGPNDPIEGDLTVALTRIDFDPKIDVAYINANADIYLFTSDNVDDGAALPTGRKRYRIPSGVCHPFRITRTRVLVAAITGTAIVWVEAVAPSPVNRGYGAIDPCSL